ncbi:MAG: cytochrome c oxidase assembly protein [Chloroflexi bacterium]|nr:cytochrome c oxidase assembly protein [Chloroflexota bacterium]
MNAMLRTLLLHWSWYPSVLIGSAALVAAYLYAVRGHLTRKAIFFFSGMLVLLIALLSPLDILSDTYLFSAHMVQHLLLIMIASPLLILGIPAEVAARLLEYPLINRIEKILRRPLLAWFLGIGTIYIWHVPLFYNATLANENIHAFEHLTFIVTAVIFWWPIFTPLVSHRLPPMAAITYLFAAAAGSSVLGLILTYAKPGLYPDYLQPEDTLGILPLIRQDWGITPAVDQQIGGLIMWVPGSGMYLLAQIVVLERWFSQPDRGDLENSQNPEI